MTSPALHQELAQVQTPTKERPILFSGEMVRAILEGRKTQTRRVVKLQATGLQCPSAVIRQNGVGWLLEKWPRQEREFGNFGRCERVACPYGQPGDRLWVREAWTIQPQSSITLRDYVFYRADAGNTLYDGKWRPSIFMPRWASRSTLQVTKIRVERVQQISEEDTIAEGVTKLCLSCEFTGEKVCDDSDSCYGDGGKFQFERLWRSINEKRGFGWDKNPWVWVIEFRRAA